MNKKSVRDLDLRGKRVLVRVDFNVPVKDGQVTDDTRIRRALPTIRYILSEGGSPIVISHLGRPKGGPDPEYAMDPVAKRLEELLGEPVLKLDAAIGPEVQEALNNWDARGVVLLENSRFYPGETKNDPEFSDQLAALADAYVDDAFGAAHRAHATTVGVAERLPASAGLLLEEEVDYLDGVLKDPERPFVAILGGAKVSDKLGVIESLLDVADTLLIGGAMCFTFFEARGYATGKSLVEDDQLDTARALLEQAGRDNRQIILPMDAVVAREAKPKVETEVVAIDSIPDDQRMLDVGPMTVERFLQATEGAAAVVWNGPLGVYEVPPFDQGTKALAQGLAGSSAETIVGGGDLVAALQELGIADRMSFVSTGGGATLEFLEGKTLPGIAALRTVDQLTAPAKSDARP